MSSNAPYTEDPASPRTEALPVGLTLVCSAPAGWRAVAGIHFSPSQGRYRAMLNFLEHPRLVVMLRHSQGPVRAVAFSTRRAVELQRRLQSLLASAGAAGGAR